jgi:hypothetical protein
MRNAENHRFVPFPTLAAGRRKRLMAGRQVLCPLFTETYEFVHEENS